jgi:hypothetical protein
MKKTFDYDLLDFMYFRILNNYFGHRSFSDRNAEHRAQKSLIIEKFE